MNERYAWRGGSELLLRHGRGSLITLLVLPALFDEANRMRRFTVSLMRALAERGIGTILPDLPGTGESIVPLEEVRLADWHDAVDALAAMIDKPYLTVAIRGGAILDRQSDRGWRLAPESGERIVRDLVRSTALSQTVTPGVIDRRARVATTRLAGNRIAPALYEALVLATTAAPDRRTARLDTDAGPRDVTLPGHPLWRASEPGDDPALVDTAAADIATWVARCAR